MARVYRNLKGSGLPLRIPAIEMVEIGAGGGSIAKVDEMKRISVGPESSGALPGPACYNQGGEDPTVTDADVILGRIDPKDFAGGAVKLDPDKAELALRTAVGEQLELNGSLSAFGVSEIVDENMANAARVHAIEWGKDISARSMIAFGGAAPLHALRLAEKLDINRVIIPSGAGVGSAIGFLRAPISYEVVRSRYISLQNFDPGIVNRLMKEMSEEARKIVASGAGASELTEQRLAYMRYEGQGHEIVVPVPLRELEAKDADTLRELFETEYSNLYGRSVPGQKPEVLSWTLSVSAPGHSSIQSSQITGNNSTPGSNLTRKIFDPALSDFVNATVYKRSELGSELKYPGPAAIVETQTTTIVPSAYSFQLNEFGHLIVEKN